MKWKLSFAALPVLAIAVAPAWSQVLSSPQDADTSKPAQKAGIPPANSAEADKPAVPVAEIVARINDQVISKADYDRGAKEMDEELREDNIPADVAEKRRAQLLSDLIDQQLLLSRGKQMNINPDDEVIRRLDEIRKQYHLDSIEDLEKAAKSQGVSFEDFKANIRNQAITQQVIRQEVAQSMHLTTADQMAYYDRHKDQFTLPESERLSEILLPSGDSDADVAAAKAKADKVYEQLKGGADFAATAKAVSTGPTAAQGGDLGVFKRGQLAGPLDTEAFALPTGGITQPIRTKQGFVILKVVDHTQAGVQPFDKVQQDVMQAAYAERMQPALREYLTKLREDAFIDIKPGYTDVNASPNETKPVFSAYAPPAKKSKKAREAKYRFRDRSQLPQKQPKLEKTSAQQPLPGGPTANADRAYDQAVAHPVAQPPPAPAPLPNEKKRVTNAGTTTKKKTVKPVKVRFGHGQQEAQLPPASTDQAQSDKTQADQAETAQTASAQTPSDVGRLSPESRKILGLQKEDKGPKTRLQNQPHVTRTQERQHDEQLRASQQAPPPDATEVATTAVNSSPLGLNGNTANPPKPKLTEKQRLSDAPKTEAPVAKPNAGTPGANTYTPDTTKPKQANTDEPKKRHKLLGIL